MKKEEDEEENHYNKAKWMFGGAAESHQELGKAQDAVLVDAANIEFSWKAAQIKAEGKVSFPHPSSPHDPPSGIDMTSE